MADSDQEKTGKVTREIRINPVVPTESVLVATARGMRPKQAEQAKKPEQAAEPALLFEGLGTHKRTVSTQNEKAQIYTRTGRVELLFLGTTSASLAEDPAGIVLYLIADDEVYLLLADHAVDEHLARRRAV